MNIFAVLQVFAAIVAITFGLVYLIRATVVASVALCTVLVYAAVEAAGCTLLIRFFVTL